MAGSADAGKPKFDPQKLDYDKSGVPVLTAREI